MKQSDWWWRVHERIKSTRFFCITKRVELWSSSGTFVPRGNCASPPTTGLEHADRPQNSRCQNFSSTMLFEEWAPSVVSFLLSLRVCARPFRSNTHVCLPIRLTLWNCYYSSNFKDFFQTFKVGTALFLYKTGWLNIQIFLTGFSEPGFFF